MYLVFKYIKTDSFYSFERLLLHSFLQIEI